MPETPDPLVALEAARARVMAQTARARALAADAARMAEDVRAASSTRLSVGREVRVSARADGGIERIDIADSALDLDAASLSRLVTETVRAAQRDAADTALRRMSESLGETSPLVASTRSAVADRLGEDGVLR